MLGLFIVVTQSERLLVLPNTAGKKELYGSNTSYTCLILIGWQAYNRGDQIHRKIILYLQNSINLIPTDYHPSYTLTSLYLMNMESKHGTISIITHPIPSLLYI